MYWPRDDPDFDLDNPDYVELVKAWLDVHAWDDASTAKLPRGNAGDDDDLKQRKVTAKAVLRACHRQHWDCTRTAIMARRDHPDLYNGKSDQQIRRNLSRA